MREEILITWPFWSKKKTALYICFVLSGTYFVYLPFTVCAVAIYMCCYRECNIQTLLTEKRKTKEKKKNNTFSKKVEERKKSKNSYASNKNHGDSSFFVCYLKKMKYLFALFNHI
jgi:hypothetical protein